MFIYLCNIFINNEIIRWAKQFSTNYNKFLFSNKIEEKIIRSFLYGKAYQYTYNIDNKGIITFINNQLLPVLKSETFVPQSSSMLFYLMKGTDFTGSLVYSYMNEFDVKWLISTNPLYFNPLYRPDIVNINNNIVYLDSIDIKKLIRNIGNYWSKDYNIWNDERTPILKYFYNKILRIISLY